VSPHRQSQRLVQLFERELRDFERKELDAAEKARRRVSRELDAQVVEFASQVRTSGSTPEQMLVELKAMLAGVAPEVSSSKRSELVATVTGRAIDAFFGQSKQPKQGS
jgi:hypothetical protein